jgi:hypothetical protein
MSTYTMAGSSAATLGPLSIGQISQIDLGAGAYGIDKKLPNKKISFDVHTAHGGYVIRVSQGYGNEDDMYVIGDSQDLGQELGKIVTHHTLAKK